jgi:hypothetical protein
MMPPVIEDDFSKSKKKAVIGAVVGALCALLIILIIIGVRMQQRKSTREYDVDDALKIDGSTTKMT